MYSAGGTWALGVGLDLTRGAKNSCRNPSLVIGYFIRSLDFERDPDDRSHRNEFSTLFLQPYLLHKAFIPIMLGEKTLFKLRAL